MADETSIKQQQETKPENQVIIIKLNNSQFDTVRMKLKKSTKVQRILQSFADTNHVNVGSLRAVDSQGVRLSKDATLLECGVEDGDEIDIMIEQLGGLTSC